MKFLVKNSKYNILNLVRGIGYHSHKDNKSFCRRLDTSEFPRFHIYIKKAGQDLEFSIHLDQKGVCYNNQTAHSGEYDSSILEEEKKRIKNLLKDLT